MSATIRIAILLAIAVYFILFVLLKKRRLTLRYTLLWLFSGAAMLVLVLFPKLLERLTNLLGFRVQSNALFAILLFFTLLIMISLTSIISRQDEYIKRLVQNVALLEKRVKDIESE